MCRHSPEVRKCRTLPKCAGTCARLNSGPPLREQRVAVEGGVHGGGPGGKDPDGIRKVRNMQTSATYHSNSISNLDHREASGHAACAAGAATLDGSSVHGRSGPKSLAAFHVFGSVL